MNRRSSRNRAIAAAITAVVVAGIAAAAPAGAAPASAPAVDVQPVAGLAPDARSMNVQVIASCPERWTVVRAVVAVTQQRGSGEAAFPLRCIGSLRAFFVTVPAATGSFELGTAHVSASVVISRGKTLSAHDAEVVPVDPMVEVVLADTARLTGAGVAIAVTVACPAGTTGVPSGLNVSQGQTSARGAYTPVCDGARHTFHVDVPGRFEPGGALALTFADVEHGGRLFSGVDDGPIQIVG